MPRDGAFQLPQPRVLVLIEDVAVRAEATEAVRSGLTGAEVVCAPGEFEPNVVVVDEASAPGSATCPMVVLAPPGAPGAHVASWVAGGADVVVRDPGWRAHLAVAVLKAAVRGRGAVAAEAQRLASLADALKAIEAENDRLHALVARLEALASTDPLTGLLNRRGFMERLEELLSGALRHGTPLALLAIDLDGLKCVNDALGHGAGDELIRHAAAVLTGVSRRSDVSARLGGDEFAVILPHTDTNGALDVAARLRTAFAEAARPISARLVSTVRDARARPPGLSVGVASAELAPDAGETSERLIARADERLYRAKGVIPPSPNPLKP